MKLYRLKSNPTIVVRKAGKFALVRWHDDMKQLSEFRFWIMKWSDELFEEITDKKEIRKVNDRARYYSRKIDQRIDSEIDREQRLKISSI